MVSTSFWARSGARRFITLVALALVSAGARAQEVAPAPPSMPPLPNASRPSLPTERVYTREPGPVPLPATAPKTPAVKEPGNVPAATPDPRTVSDNTPLSCEVGCELNVSAALEKCEGHADRDAVNAALAAGRAAPPPVPVAGCRSRVVTGYEQCLRVCGITPLLPSRPTPPNPPKAIGP